MLPIYGKKDEIVSAVSQNQVTIIVGETGTGKTTELPVILYEAGLGAGKRIGITQPRRIAAISVAEYVSTKLKKPLGTLVGYQVRFDNATLANTSIKFMTTGILLGEIQRDPELTRYQVIVIDEAHERTQEIDLLVGLLKRTLATRADLKVLVTSATIDAEKFSAFFGGAPVIRLASKTYPVEVRYLKKELPAHHLETAMAEQALTIHRSGQPGDILIFVPGFEQINKVVTGLQKNCDQSLVVLPLHGDLDVLDHQKAFRQYPGRRKVIVATNIAETSITIDGIRHVIDSGLIRELEFHPDSGIETLTTINHSQAGCDQRAGRAGRTAPGVCYRMYTENGFKARRQFTSPEIQRVNVERVLLSMKIVGISDPASFEFVDAPDKDLFHSANEILVSIGALDFRGGVTGLGKQLACLPLDPKIGRMVIETVRYKCVKSIVTFAAFLSLSDPLIRPLGKEKDADMAHAGLKHPLSDALTLIQLWNRYSANNESPAWCYLHFVNSAVLRNVGLIREQLLGILERMDLPLESTNNEDVIMKCVAAGQLNSLFCHSGKYGYAGVFQKAECSIHPKSSLFRANPKFIVSARLRHTTRTYAHYSSIVRVEWLTEFMPMLFVLSDMIVPVSYKEGDSMAGAVQAIMFHAKVAGYKPTRIPVAQAHEIYKSLEMEAMKRGDLILSFEEKDGRKFAIQDGFHIQLDSGSLIPVECGKLYYCKIGIYGGQRTAEVTCPLLDFEGVVVTPYVNGDAKPQPKAANVSKPFPKPVPKPKAERPLVPKELEGLALSLVEGWGCKIVVER